MRNLISFNMMSLDGFFEGPNGELDWHNVDEEFNKFAKEQLDSADCLLFGRKTYELMAGYWPAEGAIQDDPVIAKKMNSISKIVISKTLEKVYWNNTRLINDNVIEEIKNLKHHPGKDLFIFGSADMSAGLIPHHLIDEFRVIINPILLGKGNPLFRNINDKINLKLVKTRNFASGNVLLYYKMNK